MRMPDTSPDFLRDATSSSDEEPARKAKAMAKANVGREQLWLLLSGTKGRRVNMDVVDRLLTVFGSYAEVLSASPVDLTRYGGLGSEAVQAIVTVRTAAMHLIRTEIEHRPLLSSMPLLENYLIAAMSRMPREQFRVLFLSSKHRLISDEVISEGTVMFVTANTRQVFSLALRLGASGVILVHNHPSGDPNASLVDVGTTEAFIRAGKTLGITVHDHIIVGHAGVFSFRDQAIMRKLHRHCADR